MPEQRHGHHVLWHFVDFSASGPLLGLWLQRLATLAKDLLSLLQRQHTGFFVLGQKLARNRATSPLLLPLAVSCVDSGGGGTKMKELGRWSEDKMTNVVCWQSYGASIQAQHTP